MASFKKNKPGIMQQMQMSGICPSTKDNSVAMRRFSLVNGKYSLKSAFNLCHVSSVIFGISLLVRLMLISKGPYHVDCLTLAIRAESALDSLILEPLTGLGFPLTVILGAVFIYAARLFHVYDPVIAVNFMSVFISSLAVMVFWRFVRKNFDGKTALFSALLLMVHPIFLGLSVYGNSQILGIFFLMQGLVFVADFKKTHHWRDLILAGLFFGFMGAARVIDLILMAAPLHVFYFMNFGKGKGTSLPSGLKMKGLFVIWFLVIVVMAIFYLPFFAQGNAQQFISYFQRDWGIAAGANYLGIFSPRLKVAIGYLIDSMTPAGFYLAIIAMIIGLIKKTGHFFFLAVWFLVPLLYYGNLRMTVTSRYFLIVAPALAILLACVFSYFFQFNKIVKTATVISFLILTQFLFLGMYPVLRLRHTRAVLPDYARWAAQNMEEDAHVITADEGTFMSYYARRAILGRPIKLLNFDGDDHKIFKAKIDDILGQGIPVYITDAALWAYNREEQFSNFIFRHYNLAWVGENLFEDWHRGEMKLDIFPSALYRAYKK